MDLIDTHVHLLHPERFTYAWCAGKPALQRRFSIEDYREAVGRVRSHVKVSALMFMEADVPAAEQMDQTEWSAQLANRDRGEPPLYAIVAGAAPELPGFAAQLDRIASEARVRGLRRVLHTQPDAVLESPVLVESLRLLAARELTFDLCVRPRQLALVTALVTQCPQTQFVLDHAAAPDIAGGGDFEAWREGIKQLAARPNVACKFSGLGSLADPKQPLAPQVRPYFAHCMECFYPERMLWGTDWPVSPNLQAWFEATAELLGELSPHEQAAIGTGNAGRIYRLN